MRELRSGWCWLLISLLLIGTRAGASAQQRTQTGSAADTAQLRLLQQRALGAGLTQEMILERLRRSGMSRSQVRAGLERLGYDPGLADRYFDAIDGRRPLPDEDPSPRLVEAMTAIGVPAVAHSDQLDITSPWVDSLRADSLGVDSLFADSLGLFPDSLPAEARVFGLDLFRRFTTQFDAPLSGPVDPDYRLGPGDELSLILTGEVEASYGMEVTREGYVVLPDVGQLFVNGLTMAELEDRLYGMLGQRYSGVSRDADAPIRFHVGLRRLRASAVYVIGETVRPGAYQVSSVATVLNALYLAGGPTEDASFRNIEVRRDGEVVDTLDLYDYLLRGDTRGDVRLHHGDVIFVPVAGAQVTVEGAVRRAAIFELRQGEGIAHAIEFAGGLSSDASSHRVQVDRILPPDLRAPGVDRVLMDVDREALRGEEGVAARDGDVVRVFEILEERRNRVVVTGEVNRPGIFEWSEGMTLASLVDRADGLAEDAYTPRTHVFRLDPRDGSRHLLRVDIDAFELTPLMDRDSIVVYGVEELANPRFVLIDGFVKNPGAYPLAEGMTLQDLVLAAGGFVHGAYLVEAELARMSAHSDGTMETVSRVRLGGQPSEAGAGVVNWEPDATEVRLVHGDHVFIRKAPEYDVLGTIKVAGEVQFPGAYALGGESTRISDVLSRAGGLKPEAYVGGAQIVRGGHLVATDLADAIGSPGSAHDLELLEGDSIMIPRRDATVLVRGAVGFETRVRFEDGKSLDYYVDRAGGYAQNADRGRTTVTQQNGERQIVRLRALFFDSKPDPGPGATVFVPAKPPSSGGINWDAILTRVVAVASATATVIIAVK
jgi:protein involved in polysaccharide export with SLBB domain